MQPGEVVNNELLRQLIAEVPAAIAIFDRDMRYVAASRRWLDAYLPSVSSPQGRLHYELFPECPERWRAEHRRALTGETVSIEEDSWTLPDGTCLWMRYEVRPWKSPDEQIAGTLVLTEDITARKRAEVDLQQTHARLESALRAPQITVFQQDRHLRYTWIHNPTLGFARERVIGLTDRDLLERQDQAAHLEQIKRAVIESGVPAREEVQIDGGGQTHWYDLIVEPRHGIDGSVEGVDCVAIDISERHMAQLALQASEQRLSVARSAAGLGIHDRDVLTGEINWDSRVRELWGLTAEEPVSYSVFLSGLHPDDVAPTEAAVARALDPAGDGLYCAEYRVVNRKDGLTRWVAARGKATFLDGRLARLVGTVQDITQRREMELERERNSALLDAVLMSMPAGVIIADADGRIVRSNKAYEAMSRSR